MLCFLAGELTNGATFFTTFARVAKNRPDKEKFPGSKDYYHRKIGTFGTNPTDTWKPWTYKERVQFAAKVNEFKLKDAKKNNSKNPKTVQSRLASFISGNLQCRQVEVPLIGPWADLGKFEPLHGKNNTVKVISSFFFLS